MNLDISFQTDSPFVDYIDEALIKKAVQTALETNKEYDSFELGIVITDDENIHRINRQYRGIDEPTDVISFALLEGEDGFVMPPDDTLHLGEVVISYPRAVEQAKEQKHSTDRELAWLIVHGVLHLLGHDHETDEDLQSMQTIEGEILGKIDFK
ncbi:rRNA maturation RNase YbeY [Chloroflexota bacterium]